MNQNKNESNKYTEIAQNFFLETVKNKYSYNFEYLSRPIIQYPQDIIAFQEIVWKVKPDLIIETGIAHGGSLVLSASLLALLDYCDAIHSKSILDPNETERLVIGIDIDIRKHNRDALDAHPLRKYMMLLEGSSLDKKIIKKVKNKAKNKKTVLICLDSNHTHDHVIGELNEYSELVTKGSYCIVFDTVIEDLPDNYSDDRPWGKGNNPKTAVRDFLKTNHNFEIDYEIEKKLLITVAPDGYLKRK